MLPLLRGHWGMSDFARERDLDKRPSDFRKAILGWVWVISTVIMSPPF